MLRCMLGSVKGEKSEKPKGKEEIGEMKKGGTFSYLQIMVASVDIWIFVDLKQKIMPAYFKKQFSHYSKQTGLYFENW